MKKQLKQIYRELISREFDFYWQETGHNDRLKNYQKMVTVTNILLFITQIFITIIITKLLLYFLIGLVDQTSLWYEFYTINEFVEILKNNVIQTTMILLIPCLILWITFDLLSKYEFPYSSSELLFVVKNRILQSITLVPIYVLSLLVVMSTTQNIKIYTICFLLLFIKVILKSFIARVSLMEDFAYRRRNVWILKGRARTAFPKVSSDKYEFHENRNFNQSGKEDE